MMEGVFEYLMLIVGFAYANFWHLLMIAIIIFNYKGLIVAFRGGNGKWQIDEVSKVVLLIAIVFVIYTEATRPHEWSYFSDIVIILLLFVQIIQAKMEKVLEYFDRFIDKWKRP